MSYAAERWARAQRVGNARAKQVLVELANCHNGKTGKCTPGIKYLHEVTELKEDTISTATNFLQSKGFIKKTYVAVEKGRAISYELLGFNPQEWERKKTEDSTENGLTQNRGNPESVGPPETGATDSPENGGRVPPNSGVKQGIRTGKGTGKLCARLPEIRRLTPPSHLRKRRRPIPKTSTSLFSMKLARWVQNPMSRSPSKHLRLLPKSARPLLDASPPLHARSTPMPLSPMSTRPSLRRSALGTLSKSSPPSSITP